MAMVLSYPVNNNAPFLTIDTENNAPYRYVLIRSYSQHNNVSQIDGRNRVNVCNVYV